MIEDIWYRDFRTFFSIKNLPRFVPSNDMTYTQKLNSIMRFSLYFSALLYIIKHNILVWYFAVFAAFATIFLNEFSAKNKKLQRELYDKINVMYNNKSKQFCKMPTQNNPFMNVLMNEYSEFPNRPSACDLGNQKITKKAENYFEQSLYRDVDDVWGRKSSSRNWHTVPGTTIPNNREGFGKWLYGTGPTCKEGNGMSCYNNLYHSYN